MLDCMRWAFAFLLPLVLAVACGADVYKWVDEDGNTIYSDEPHPEAEKLENVEIPVVDFPEPAAPPRAREAERKERRAPEYRAIRVTSPSQDATVRNTPGNVSVTVAVEPVLQNAYGHRIALYLAGALQGEPGRRTSFQLQNVDRGTHTVSAAVLDADGKKLISSQPVTFHLHRNFIRQSN